MFFDQYKALWKVLVRYYNGYGGLWTFATSPFVHASLLITAVGWVWDIGFDWRKVSEGTIPTLLGFSLAAYTLIFTLMGGELHTALARIIEQRRSVNYLAVVNSTFFHAIFVQLVTYLFSLVSSGSALYELVNGYIILGFIRGSMIAHALPIVADLFGNFLAMYSIMLTIGILVAVFRLAYASQSNSN